MYDRTAKFRFALTALSFFGAASLATAATSFSNSLTGFTGNSTEAPLQTTFAAAGFDFASIDGPTDQDGDTVIDHDATVVFDAAGAHFGTLWAGDGGRNYVRTTQADYATGSFTVDITFVAPDLATQDVFLGVGAGEIALFGWPDWSTLHPSVVVLPEITDGGVSQLTTFKTVDDVNAFANTAAPNLLDGTHRVRLAFNEAAKTANFAVDVNYAGGAFIADYTATPVNITDLYAGLNDPWPTLGPSKIYFGGDDGVILKDFSVSVGPVVGLFDVDGDGVVDGKELLVWQRGLGINSGATLQQGDADGDHAVKKADLAVWKSQYGTGYAVPAIGSVPEPASASLVVAAAFALAMSRRRGR
jgi:hypothetical protein